jgi:hypothetical protein
MNSNKQPSIFRRSEYTNAAMTKRLAKMTSKSTPSFQNRAKPPALPTQSRQKESAKPKLLFNLSTFGELILVFDKKSTSGLSERAKALIALTVGALPAP